MDSKAGSSNISGFAYKIGDFMKRNNNYILHNVGDTYYLSYAGDAEQENRQVLFINETCAYLWEQLAETSDFDTLLTCFLNTYDVDAETAKRDIAGFLSFLSENRCLETED